MILKKFLIALILIIVITILLPFHIFLLGYANQPEKYLVMINVQILLSYFLHFTFYFLINRYLKFKLEIYDLIICILLYINSYSYLYYNS
jgi:heme/copper-type cytochrome/quinol oxidase subunit 4